jgi:alginate O-acetyltransferase complex protein AlgI
MWLLAGGLYFGLKFLAWRLAAPLPPSRRKLGWWLAWPGMDARRFMTTSRGAAPTAEPKEWLVAVAKTILGAVLFALGAKISAAGWLLPGGWIGMIGFVIAIHCGVFHLLSCVWRSRGVDAPPIMNRPLVSQSVAEFWGRRWNRAFRDVGYFAVFRPLAPRWGAEFASFAVFVVSALIHEVAITLPAGSGFGLPTVYFLIQGAALRVERSRLGTRLSLGRKWRGRVFALISITAPLPLLFPAAFVLRVVVPFMNDTCPF